MYNKRENFVPMQTIFYESALKILKFFFYKNVLKGLELNTYYAGFFVMHE